MKHPPSFRQTPLHAPRLPPSPHAGHTAVVGTVLRQVSPHQVKLIAGRRTRCRSRSGSPEFCRQDRLPVGRRFLMDDEVAEHGRLHTESCQPASAACCRAEGATQTPRFAALQLQPRRFATGALAEGTPPAGPSQQLRGVRHRRLADDRLDRPTSPWQLRRGSSIVGQGSPLARSKAHWARGGRRGLPRGLKQPGPPFSQKEFIPHWHWLTSCTLTAPRHVQTRTYAAPA